MPMVGSALGAAIKTQITSIPGINITNTAELTAFCNAIGTAVVTYIQANALVATNDTGSVTTGPGAGGVVVATGIGTVS